MPNKPVREKVILLFVFVLLSSVSFAQQDPKADSLLKVLKNQKDDTSKVNTLNALSKQFLNDKNIPDAKKYVQNALVLAQKISFKKGEAAGYRNEGMIYTWEYNFSDAMKSFSSFLKISEEAGDKNDIATAYNSIANSYFHQGNYPEALKNHFASLKIKKETDDKEGIITSYNNIGLVYWNQGNYPEAYKNYFAALKISEDINDESGVAHSYNVLGVVYDDEGNYPEALKNYLASLKIYEKLSLKFGIAGCYNNIGELYRKQNNSDEAVKNYQASLKIYEEIGDKGQIAMVYNNIAGAYQDKGNYKEAMKNCQAALNIDKEINDKVGIASAYGNMAILYHEQGKKQSDLSQRKELFDESLKNCFTGLKIFKEVNYLDGVAESYTTIGSIYTDQKKYAEARKFLDDGLFLSKKRGVKDMIKNSYEALVKLDSAMGNWKGAFLNQVSYLLLRDSSVNKENSEKILRLQMQYEFEKKEDSLKYQQQLSDEKLKQQTLLTQQQKHVKNYLLAGLVLFALLAFFIYRNYRTRQKLKLQNLRNKIAIDLHDEVGSTLSSISIFSQMAQEQSKETIPLLETIGESSRKMLDAMADIVWSINSENDQFEKIILRMRSFAYELLGTKKIDFEFIVDDDVAKMKLPMNVRKNLYLIFKEATNNMVKYSEANKALFTIKGEKNSLSLLIRDNGKGFNTDEPEEGNGLKNMKKRAIEIGSNLVIDSQPGEGTTIQLKVVV